MSMMNIFTDPMVAYAQTRAKMDEFNRANLNAQAKEYGRLKDGTWQLILQARDGGLIRVNRIEPLGCFSYMEGYMDGAKVEVRDPLKPLKLSV